MLHITLNSVKTFWVIVVRKRIMGSGLRRHYIHKRYVAWRNETSRQGAGVEVVDDSNDDDDHTLYYEQCSMSRGMLCNQ
jgi:hypothetical protein